MNKDEKELAVVLAEELHKPSMNSITETQQEVGIFLKKFLEILSSDNLSAFLEEPDDEFLETVSRFVSMLSPTTITDDQLQVAWKMHLLSKVLSNCINANPRQYGKKTHELISLATTVLGNRGKNNVMFMMIKASLTLDLFFLKKYLHIFGQGDVLRESQEEKGKPHKDFSEQAEFDELYDSSKIAAVTVSSKDSFAVMWLSEYLERWFDLATLYRNLGVNFTSQKNLNKANFQFVRAVRICDKILVQVPKESKEPGSLYVRALTRRIACYKYLFSFPGRSQYPHELEVFKLDRQELSGLSNKSQSKMQAPATKKRKHEQYDTTLFSASQMSLQTDEYKKLDKALGAAALKYGYQCRKIKSDGDCLYAAAAIQLETTVEALKRKILDHVLENYPCYKSIIPDVNEFIDETMPNGKWGEYMHAVIISRAFKKTVVIVPSAENEPPIVIKQNNAPEEKAVILGYIKNLHFDALTRISGLTVGKSLTDYIKAAPMDIADSHTVPALHEKSSSTSHSSSSARTPFP